MTWRRGENLTGVNAVLRHLSAAETIRGGDCHTHRGCTHRGDDGVRILGSAQRHRELEEKIAGDRPTFEEARERVSNAARRLREEFA